MLKCPRDYKAPFPECCKNNYSCYMRVDALDYGCLALHSEVYKKTPAEVLYGLYGKKFQMTSSLALKATRVSYAMSELQPEPGREIFHSLEKRWVREIEGAGPLEAEHWSVITANNGKTTFRKRMLQVLNTMEAADYSLIPLLVSYKAMFKDIDLKAFALLPEDLEVVNRAVSSLALRRQP